MTVTFKISSGAVFKKGLSQVLGLTFVQKYNQLKPETWLRPFVNTAPGLYLRKGKGVDNW